MSSKGMFVTSNKPIQLRKLPWAKTLLVHGWLVLKLSLPIFSLAISLAFLVGMSAAQGEQNRTGASAAGGNPDPGSDQPPKPIKIEVDSPLKETMRLSLSGLEPPESTALEFYGSTKKPWVFVKFDTLPSHVTLFVKGDLPAYSDSEKLFADTWYPFRQMLPVILKVDKQATAPIALQFRFGYPTENDAKYFTTNPSPNDVRAFAPSHVKENTDIQILALYWGPSVVSLEPQSVKFPVENNKDPQSLKLTGDRTLWTFIRQPQATNGIELTISGSQTDLTVRTGTTLNAGEWVGFKGLATLDIRLNPPQVEQAGNSTVVLETAIAQSPDQTKDSIIEDIKANKIKSTNGNMRLVVSWESPESGIDPIRVVLIVLGFIAVVVVAIVLWKVVNKPRKGGYETRKTQGGGVVQEWKPNKRGGRKEIQSARKEIPGSTLGIDRDSTPPPLDQETTLVAPVGRSQATAPAIQPPVSPALPSEDRAELTRLKNNLEALRGEIQSHLNKTPKIPAAKEYVDQALAELLRQMNQLRSDLETRLSTTAASQEGRNTQFEANQKVSLDELIKLRLYADDIAKDKTELVGNLETRLASRLDQLEAMLVEQAFPESFFARTMGMILSKNVNELQEGNLERLIGESINHFFQADVPRSESLQELRERADSIVGAIRRVVELISKENPELEDEARSRLQRAEALLEKVSGLQSQLQSRKITIDTTLRLTVSAYPGARQTFLDELGRGIRKEIDKLGNPESYFEGDVERLITTDLIAIVDICDKKVSSQHGPRTELEAALKQLFEQAGLREIVPHVGEPFGTAEQDLVQMVTGASGTNMTIAEVKTRGFYYKHRDHETLLRKAGVSVYR